MNAQFRELLSLPGTAGIIRATPLQHSYCPGNCERRRGTSAQACSFLCRLPELSLPRTDVETRRTEFHSSANCGPGFEPCSRHAYWVYRRAIGQALSPPPPRLVHMGSIASIKWYWGRFLSQHFSFPCQLSLHPLVAISRIGPPFVGVL
jgi:hypothetical protein